MTRAGKNILQGLPSLRFEFKKGTEIKTSVVIKIPFPYSIDEPELVITMFDRKHTFMAQYYLIYIS